MQDLTAAGVFQAAMAAGPAFPQEEQNLRCPRCDSANTKFCYYNNYNLSQPRHFCKSCRRYWTKGGALRNIPVGGGTRKNSKRASSSSSSSSSSFSHAKRSNTSSASSSSPAAAAPKMELLAGLYPASDADRQMLDMAGSFTSLLATSGHFVSLLDVVHAGVPPGVLDLPGAGVDPTRPIGAIPPLELHSPSNGSESSGNAPPPPPPPPPQQAPLPDSFLGLQGDSNCWTGGGGWPDLAIYTPGSTFH